MIDGKPAKPAKTATDMEIELKPIGEAPEALKKRLVVQLIN